MFANFLGLRMYVTRVCTKKLAVQILCTLRLISCKPLNVQTSLSHPREQARRAAWAAASPTASEFTSQASGRLAHPWWSFRARPRYGRIHVYFTCGTSFKAHALPDAHGVQGDGTPGSSTLREVEEERPTPRGTPSPAVPATPVTLAGPKARHIASTEDSPTVPRRLIDSSDALGEEASFSFASNKIHFRDDWIKLAASVDLAKYVPEVFREAQVYAYVLETLCLQLALSPR